MLDEAERVQQHRQLMETQVQSLNRGMKEGKSENEIRAAVHQVDLTYRYKSWTLDSASSPGFTRRVVRPSYVGSITLTGHDHVPKGWRKRNLSLAGVNRRTSMRCLFVSVSVAGVLLMSRQSTRRHTTVQMEAKQLP